MENNKKAHKNFP